MRKTVNYVVMDSSALFRLVAQRMFPHAVIICDKYHIVRQVIWAMENVRKWIQDAGLAEFKSLLHSFADRFDGYY